MELPRTLAPWAAQLRIFPPEVALALGPLVRRLAVAIGPFAGNTANEGVEPDGFDGLSRRGPYDRLILSELAVLDEFPDEFMRRAVMGEHHFHRVALQTPVRSRVSAVLFDAGPNQLGSLRIAHIAALIAFARRAAVASAEFRWGVLQRPDLPWYEEVLGPDVIRLLGLRSALEATTSHCEVWSARVDDLTRRDDVWIVGGVRLTRLPAGLSGSFVEVRDPCETDDRRIDVAIWKRRSVQRGVRLELPDDRSCTRLIRDPFGSAVGPTRDISSKAVPSSNIVFDSTGIKLLSRGQWGELIAYPVPNSPRGGVGSPKTFGHQYAGKIVAAGRAHRANLMASLHDGKISLSSTRRCHAAPPGFYAIQDITSQLVDTGALGLIVVPRPVQSERSQPLVHLPSGQLLLLCPDVRITDNQILSGTARIVAEQTLAIAALHTHVVYVGRERLDEPYRIVTAGTSITRDIVPFDAEPVASELFGDEGGGARADKGVEHQAAPPRLLARAARP